MTPNIAGDLRQRIEVTFALLNRRGARGAFPEPMALSAALEKALRTSSEAPVHLKPEVATMFATAAVDVWLRAVHSFLISASLTEASPIWASTCGYYASHYCMRAFAHLLGYFHLFRRKRIARLEMRAGRHLCSFAAKQCSDREHRFYRRVVKHDSHFSSDPLFTDNQEDDEASDGGHRNRGNYGDHVGLFPNFRPLDEGSLKRRVEYISRIEFNSPPIPKMDRFPDIESVQVVAYHRIVRFRRFLDEIVGGKSRFWNVHRNPSWAAEMIDFQLTEQPRLYSVLSQT